MNPRVFEDEESNSLHTKVHTEIKEEIKEAILEGTIRNNEEEARQYMFKIAKEKGLEKEVQN